MEKSLAQEQNTAGSDGGNNGCRARQGTQHEMRREGSKGGVSSDAPRLRSLRLGAGF